MWSSRLFWKLFVSYALLNLAATVTFVLIVSGWQQDLVIEQVRQRLHDSAVLVRSQLEELLPEGRSEKLQSQVRRLGNEIDTRITLVSMDGVVLADSKREGLAQVAEMENHKGRLELVHAATRGYGTSQRISPTLGEPMIYVALRAGDKDSPAGLVRTALPMTEIQGRVGAIQRLIWVVALSVSVGVVVLSYLVAARMVQPVRTLTEAAEAIAAGDYQHHVYLTAEDEIGTLARTFNRMNDQLSAREAELRESSQHLTSVLEGMAEGVLALDDQQGIVLANAAAGRMLEFSPASVVGRNLLEVVRNHALHQAVTEASLEQRSRMTEIELTDDNRVLSVNTTFLPGEPSTRYIVVLQDITEMRRMDSLRQEFVANVSHELKTPLSSIKAYAETLINGAINDEGRNVKFVRRIEEQAERLHQLILDLLSLARIETGKQVFDIALINIGEIVRSCLDQQQAAAAANEIELVTVGASPELLVRADEEGMRQILNNLIDNAIKYTPKGGKVTVGWRSVDSMAMIEVQDTGFGVAPEHLPRLFERFYRVDKARSRELGGTGLGLSIVKHLTQSFGGNVSVESRAGSGSKFTVRLPQA